MRQIDSLHAGDATLLLQKRIKEYRCIDALRRAGLGNAAIECLTKADAFLSVHLDRQGALCEAPTRDIPHSPFDGQAAADAVAANVSLSQMTLSEHVVEDYAVLSLSLKAAQVRFLLEQLRERNVNTNGELASAQNGSYVKIAGLVKVCLRPETAKGVCFVTIEDETGFANFIVFKTKFEGYRKAILNANLIMMEGTPQIEGGVINLIVNGCHDFSSLLRHLTPGSLDEKSLQTLSKRDEKGKPVVKARTPQKQPNLQGNLLADAKNFRLLDENHFYVSVVALLF